MNSFPLPLLTFSFTGDENDVESNDEDEDTDDVAPNEDVMNNRGSSYDNYYSRVKKEMDSYSDNVVQASHDTDEEFEDR